MDFIKVARSEEKGSEEDEDYGAGDGVKFQTEWLPVEGSVPEFLSIYYDPLMRTCRTSMNSTCHIEWRSERNEPSLLIQ